MTPKMTTQPAKYRLMFGRQATPFMEPVFVQKKIGQKLAKNPSKGDCLLRQTLGPSMTVTQKWHPDHPNIGRCLAGQGTSSLDQFVEQKIFEKCPKKNSQQVTATSQTSRPSHNNDPQNGTLTHQVPGYI